MQVATKSDGSHELWMEGAVRQRMRKGTSGYTFRKLVTHFMNMRTGFSTVPLQFASIIGFFLCSLGLAS